MKQRRKPMLTYFNRIGFLGCVLMLTGLYGCATISPQIQAQEAVMSRASYEQIRPEIEKIQVGDEMSSVLEIAMPKKDNAKFMKVSKLGQQDQIFIFPMWPGVLTPLLNPREYLAMRDYSKGVTKNESQLPRHLPFGYLDGAMLRPRKILIFENKKVSKIIDIPEIPDIADLEKLKNNPEVKVEKVESFDQMRKPAYEKFFLPKKDQITPGMDFLEVFSLLNASYIITSDAQSFVMICPGYLNYKQSVKAEKTPEGVRAVYPFGYLEGDTEIRKWDVEMLNYRVVGVRAHVE
jgi:hypothetical protein